MSEYQYYDFQAVDRRLGEMEMQQLRRYSSRAEITPTSFTNEYSFGDFKGHADLWLENFMKFLRLDSDLFAAAAAASLDQQPPATDREAMAAWVADLPAQEKNSLLVRIIEGGDAHIGPELYSRFRRRQTSNTPVAKPRRRTAGELLAVAEAQGTKHHRDENRKATEAKAERARWAAIARAKHLDAIAGRELELWAQVEELIATRLPKSYDLALQHLVDLRDLAVRQGRADDTARRVAALHEAHARKSSFIARLVEKGM